MKRQTLIALVIGLTIFFGCEDSIDQRQEPLTYHGKEVLETTPSFVISKIGVSAKSLLPNSEIQADPPYGTVYGQISDPDNVYLAQGGELLPDSTWTDQIYADLYGATLFSNAGIYFKNPAIVTITNAIDCQYLDVNDVWVPVTGDATVTAQAVSTGAGGSAYIETDSLVLLGHAGTNG